MLTSPNIAPDLKIFNYNTRTLRKNGTRVCIYLGDLADLISLRQLKKIHAPAKAHMTGSAGIW